MTATIEVQPLPKILGRHTRLALQFSWTLAGQAVDLQSDGYQVRVWVRAVDGTTVAGPFSASVEGTQATYVLRAVDLATASPSANNGRVHIVAVAEQTSGDNVLVSDARAITVGDWGGADTYEPIS